MIRERVPVLRVLYLIYYLFDCSYIYQWGICAFAIGLLLDVFVGEDILCDSEVDSFWGELSLELLLGEYNPVYLLQAFR